MKRIHQIILTDNHFDRNRGLILYKCIECNDNNFKRVVVKNNYKIGFLTRILIFLRLKENPNISKIEIHCQNCGRVYTISEIQQYSVDKLPYSKKNFLMTKVENNFYKVLQKVIPPGTVLVPQVSLSSLVKTSSRSYRNKVDRKSVDFVLFKDNYFNPLLVIELDDSSHKRVDRIERDHFVDLVLLKVNLPIIHYKLTNIFDEDEIKGLIDAKLRQWKYEKFK